jgi:parvulin-like peptidyl-prolyl isomerase
VESSYGLHLVKVTAVSPPQTRPFADVRERLLEEWRRERQEAAQAQLLQGLIQKYRVTVDPAVRPFLGPLADQVEVRP